MNVQNSVVPALERALNIIEYIAAHNEPVTLKQITSPYSVSLRFQTYQKSGHSRICF